MTTYQEIKEWVALVKYQDWVFYVGEDGSRIYLQIHAVDKCSETGEPYAWTSRKWFISKHMTKSEVIQTALKAVLTAVEHEAREHFKYEGLAIFGPHYDVDKLADLIRTNKFKDART